ncbi:GntR family transcriptional regulator [Sphingomonas histidinilytica]|uniref:Regulatory protein, gntR family n=1 Tax=Rhizorhabdus histidinilytica TaxID=439228 RepID=A0A1T5G2T9_9SPHN|nr:GntR family transcriptional regulator [Rhizorhabdus histidinilytica]MBO9378361.1 GntR family transcriptional regulator [Rhizorhabdus histidinilytica]SKC02687.1 regulatory protein, gntR family [Rhizorhabdus histidinilytica]
MAYDKDTIRTLVIDGVRTGKYPPGARVKISELAGLARMSPIPVRETLAQLVGEGFLAELRGVGFLVPRRHAYELEQIYRLRGLLAVAAVPLLLARKSFGSDMMPVDAPLWDWFVAEAQDSAIATAWLQTDRALLPYRRYEPQLPVDGDLVRNFSIAMGTRDARRLRTLARRSHDALARAAPLIVRRAEAKEYGEYILNIDASNRS